MHASILCLFTLLSTCSAFSWPPGHGWKAAPDDCLTYKTATQTADNIQHFFSNYSNAWANDLLATNYTDQTDSVQWLMNNGTECPKPLGSLTFPNRTILEQAQGAQGSIPWHNEEWFWNCDHVFIRWVSNQKPQRVQGILIAQTEPNPKNSIDFPYVITKMYSEFNSGAWLVNLGRYNGTSVVPCS